MDKHINKLIILFCLLVFIVAQSKAIDNTNIKKRIMIDLDGVLDNYTSYSEKIPDIKEGARNFILRLSDNYELVLYTTRNTKSAVEWLQKNKIDKYFADVTNVKYPAYIYLDDRAIQFKGNYNETLDEIKNFKVYWKDR